MSPTLPQDFTMAQALKRTVATHGDRVALRTIDDAVNLTWAQLHARAEAVGRGLHAIGLDRGHSMAMMLTNRPEFNICDLGAMLLGATPFSIYNTCAPEQIEFIFSDSGAHILVTEQALLANVLTAREKLRSLRHIVVVDGEPPPGACSLAEIETAGAISTFDISSASAAIAPEDVLTLIYTSGTTGKPKGVRLRHEAWVYTGGVISDMGLLDGNDLQLLWLPLAHAFGKVLIATQVACGFATAIDGRVDKIVENCGIVKPTFMGAAPRIFEKAYAKIVTQQKGAKAVLFGWAFAVGKEVARRRREGKFVWPHLVLQQKLFDGLVFAKIRDVFGGRIRFFISGSAPLNRDIAEWFEAAGVLILEGYGLTESSGAGFINRPDNYKLGTVGLPFEGTEVRISDAGEVQFRSDCVMAGYHHLDDATADSLKDGWLSTGDQGKLDDDGFLSITGRIKELFKLSNGKYVAPPAVEAKFATLCPYASQFMVFGEGRNFAVALVTLDADSISGWAKDHGLSDTSYEELTKHDAVHGMIDEHVQKLNAGLNRWETIKKWAVLDEDLSVEGGQLTPSLKVKRGVVAEQNKETLDAFYS